MANYLYDHYKRMVAREMCDEESAAFADLRNELDDCYTRKFALQTENLKLRKELKALQDVPWASARQHYEEEKRLRERIRKLGAENEKLSDDLAEERRKASHSSGVPLEMKKAIHSMAVDISILEEDKENLIRMNEKLSNDMEQALIGKGEHIENLREENTSLKELVMARRADLNRLDTMLMKATAASLEDKRRIAVLESRLTAAEDVSQSLLASKRIYVDKLAQAENRCEAERKEKMKKVQEVLAYVTRINRARCALAGDDMTSVES